jgi:predicted RND superfamily exporter protein
MMRNGVQYSIRYAGRSIFVGALTTIAAFLSMVIVDSPGLQHIGIMTGLGILIFYTVMVFLLPGWLILFSTRMKIRAPKPDRLTKKAKLFRVYYTKYSRWVIIGITAFAIPCTYLMVQNFISFNYTPTAALPQTIESTQSFRLLQEHGLGFSVDDSIIAFVDDPKKMYTMEETLLNDSRYIGSVMSLATYLPRSIVDDYDTFRQETIRVLNDAQNAFTLIVLKRLNVYEDIEAIMNILVESRSFSQFALNLFESDLFPSVAKDFFTMEMDGKLAFKVYAFSKVNLWSGNQLKYYVEDLNELGFEFFGYPIIYYQIARKVISSIIYSVLVALVLIVIPVVVTLKDFSLSLIALVSLMMNLVILFGMSYLFGSTINFMTLLGLPLLLGMAIDAPVHFLIRYKEEVIKGRVWHQSDFIREVFLGTGKAVTLSALTTAIAFFSFLIASSPLLLEFGTILGAGILINWGLTFAWVAGIRIYIDQKRGNGRDGQ